MEAGLASIFVLQITGKEAGHGGQTFTVEAHAMPYSSSVQNCLLCFVSAPSYKKHDLTRQCGGSIFEHRQVVKSRTTCQNQLLL